MPRYSQDWLNAYEAKHRGRHPTTLSTAPGVDKESKLHKDIAAYCRTKGWIALHGTMAEAVSRTLGEPDFTILAEGGLVLLIECKTAKGKLSLEQEGMRQWASRLGHTIHICRCMDDFHEVIRIEKGTIK